MKNILISTLAVTLFSQAALASPAPSKQCQERAFAIVKSVVSVTNSSTAAREAMYSVSDYKDEGKADRITVQAFGIDGEDSDTYLEYELVLQKFVSTQKCYTLDSMIKVGEN